MVEAIINERFLLSFLIIYKFHKIIRPQKLSFPVIYKSRLGNIAGCFHDLKENLLWEVNKHLLDSKGH